MRNTKCLKICLLLLFLFIQITSKAQLKASNYLFLKLAKYKIEAWKGNNGIRGYTINNTNFSFRKDLHFTHFNEVVASRGCCSYQEVKRIPKEWNIIKVENIVTFLEKEPHILNPFKNKIFIVEKDKCKNIFKVYQVNLVQNWLMD
ncbi:hypothetical protein [Daejeonella oryzae]|uniref:hypothetical protein n=1 Tax=Daejeonella oryzae TaxID=1122943 RepID=UPI00047C6DE1|nr:hypothetical protein [Daejeonella oryzae]